MPTYVRVKDPQTRHEFDMPENHPHITNGLVEVVKPKQYPPAPVMRAPKHHLSLAGRSTTRSASESSGSGESTEKEK